LLTVEVALTVKVILVELLLSWWLELRLGRNNTLV